MADFDSTRLPDRIWAAVRCEPWFDPLRDYVRAAVDHTVATLAGQVANIAVKKRIVKRAATLPELTGIVDRLRIVPTRRMRDDEISAQVVDALAREPVLTECSLGRDGKEWRKALREVRHPLHSIGVAVRDGVVTLDGDVPGLAHKQIAGVLAWWVPGTRDVINDLDETTPVENVDDELTDIVRRMLAKDPVLDASRIEVHTRDGAVQLRGRVPTGPQREQAEFDAWYVFGVDGVDNRIEVGA
jgi:osmotically-inducible protein OsmY